MFSEGFLGHLGILVFTSAQQKGLISSHLLDQCIPALPKGTSAVLWRWWYGNTKQLQESLKPPSRTNWNRLRVSHMVCPRFISPVAFRTGLDFLHRAERRTEWSLFRMPFYGLCSASQHTVMSVAAGSLKSGLK